MAYLIRAIFAFWYGTLLSYSFAGVKINKSTLLKICGFFIVSLILQTLTDPLNTNNLAERLYPFTTHIPLIIWLIMIHKVKWEISFGAVVTAYLCCELPNWASQFPALALGLNYETEVLIYCISSIIILLLLLKYMASSLYSLLSTNLQVCLTFTAVPFIYYLWCYSTTVYSSFLKQHGYAVALTMSALFNLLFLLFAITQNKRRKDIELMRKLELAKDAEQQAKLEAIQANKAKGEFLANMSHEIRTPINSILGFDEMILRESNEPQIQDYALNIKASGQSLLYLINDILDITKIESEKMSLDLAEYDFKNLISKVILMIEPRIDSKGLMFEHHIDSHIPSKLYGDEMRIQQILINILTNALKYTNTGKVSLTVEMLEKIDNTLSLHFSIKDTGIGIKEEDQDVLFEAFRRVDLANTRAIEGTGLGLTITTKLLKLMGSSLNLHSIYGLGSDFYFTLKQEIIDHEEIGEFQKGFQEITVEDTYHEHFIAPDANILVIDDNNLNLLVFKGLLKNSQMNIVTASSGSEALGIILNNYFDIVFMDHLMPKMDGIETLKIIQNDTRLNVNAPIIIALTANAVVGAKEMYLQAGFTDYLQKPISGQILENVIKSYLPASKVQNVTKIEISNNVEEVSNTADTLLNQKMGIELCAGDHNFYYEVLKAFVETHFIDSLNTCLDTQDFKTYQVVVHGVKSSAKSIGAIPLSELALDLELALKERNDIEYIKNNHETIIFKIKEIEDIITSLLNS